MGILLTLFYVATAYLAASTVLGGLAEYHVQVYIALLIIAISVFQVRGSHIFRYPQTYAILLFPLPLACSLALAGVTSLIPSNLQDFFPTAAVFFFIVLNFRTLNHLKWLVGMLMLAALFIIVQGIVGMNAVDYNNPYVMFMRVGEDGADTIMRLRGLGFLNDPNDLTQVLVGLIPLSFIFWRKNSYFNNTAFVLFPVIMLIYGMFLTHSRGGMVALLAMVIFMGRRKVGILPSVLGGGLLYLALSVAGWSGGRDLSASAGTDRMDAWGEGLSLLHQHPLFGIGFNRFAENYEITAHNTVVVCFAEVGLIGFFLWMMLIVCTMRDVNSGARPPVESDESRQKKLENESTFARLLRTRQAVSAPLAETPMLEAAVAGGPPGMAFRREVRRQPAIADRFSAGTLPDDSGSPQTFRRIAARVFPSPNHEDTSDEEIRRICNLVIGSLVTFFTAGWFLSRAYTMPLFLNMGIGMVVYRMAWERGLAPAPLGFVKAAKLAVLACLAMLMAIYLIIRLDHLLPK